MMNVIELATSVHYQKAIMTSLYHVGDGINEKKASAQAMRICKAIPSQDAISHYLSQQKETMLNEKDQSPRNAGARVSLCRDTAISSLH
jgi:hypothetical protein